MQVIEGGICAAKGFLTGAVHCGIRKSQSKKDLAVIYSEVPCSTAAVYTRNKVKADPLLVTKEHLKNGVAQAITVNSGNANACAPLGKENAIRQAQAAASLLGIDPEDVIVASTGVIGKTLPIELIEEGTKQIEVIANNSNDTAKAIMTTDTKEKEYAVSFMIGDKECHIGGICKGSGMIHPNMGTMLCFITSDVAIDSTLLQKALLDNTNKTFNRVVVDGDTSTNDMCVVLANGLAGNEKITEEGEAFETVKAALKAVMEDLAKKIAADGEGASRLLTCIVNGGSSEEQAETLCMSVCSSSLFKAAMFGSDANWGRVLCAMGYSGAEFDPETVDVSFSSVVGKIDVCKNGKGLDFDEDLAKKILLEDSVTVTMDIHEGDQSCTCWGCDLTYDYVKINGDYRT